MSKNGRRYRRCECNAKTFWSCWEDGQCPYCGIAGDFKESEHGHGGFNRAQTIIILQVKEMFGFGSFEEAHSLLGTKRLSKVPVGERNKITSIIKKDMVRTRTHRKLTLTRR